MNYYRGNVPPCNHACSGTRMPIPSAMQPTMQQVPHVTSHKEHRSLAMAYVPWQEYKDLYDPETAWRQGTLFQQLDLPFSGKRG